MYSTRNTKINLTDLTYILSQLGDSLYRNDLINDTRKLTHSSIFCAYPGSNTDGRDFIDYALSKNIKLVLYETQDSQDLAGKLGIPISNLQHYLGLLAREKYYASKYNFTTIGVTGTNGKTTITHWLNQAFKLLNKITAVIGTNGIGIYPNIEKSNLTTPGAIELHQHISEFIKNNVDILAMEVSSHALTQGRVNGISFEAAIFTNLTQDHLDYHLNMENYYQAKKDLFFWCGLKCAIINIDDGYGRRLIKELAIENPSLQIISYGINSGDIQATNIQANLNQLTFTLSYNGETAQVSSQIIGLFNIYNFLAVVGYLIKYGVTKLEIIAQILSQLKPVSGRMQTITKPNKPLVVIDFSHTPDSLSKALETLTELKKDGNLICVFGCGGNRDRGKRPIMGQIATKLADQVIITSDNPRFEDPLAIINDITTNLIANNYQVVVNRAEAIENSIRMAKINDIILIAGKGHEEYQEINAIKHYFSDTENAILALEKWN